MMNKNDIADYTPQPKLMPWLTYQSCLSDKLRELVSDVSMKVLKETWCNANWWDKYRLNIEGEVHHREIVMYGNNKLCWYARTIIPRKTYDLNLQLFKRLETEPLGNLLFDAKTQITRTSFKYYAIDKNSIEFTWLGDLIDKNVSSLWMRLSTFTVKNDCDLYLAEIYLPGLLQIVKK